MKNPNSTIIASRDLALTPEQIKTLEQAGVIPTNTPQPQIAVFAAVCSEKRLSPFSKEIYLVNYGGKYSIIVGINGFRKIAAESGQLAGVDDAIFDLQPGGAYKTAADLKAANRYPITATVTVYRMVGGQRCPFSHTAVFSGFAGQGKWQTMPFQMLAKTAEAFALRKGFSDRLTGLNVEEEAEAIMDETAVALNQHETARQKAIQALREKMERANMTDEEIAKADTCLADPQYPLEKIWKLVEKVNARISEQDIANDPAKQFKNMKIR